MLHTASFPQACNRIPGDEHREGVHAEPDIDNLSLYVIFYALFGFSCIMPGNLSGSGTTEIVCFVKLDNR